MFLIRYLFPLSQSMEDVYLNYVCYAILFFSFAFSLAHLPTGYGVAAPSASPGKGGDAHFVQADGVWQLVVVIFLVYTMLPMKVPSIIRLLHSIFDYID